MSGRDSTVEMFDLPVGPPDLPQGQAMTGASVQSPPSAPIHANIPAFPNPAIGLTATAAMAAAASPSVAASPTPPGALLPAITSPFITAGITTFSNHVKANRELSEVPTQALGHTETLAIDTINDTLASMQGLKVNYPKVSVSLNGQNYTVELRDDKVRIKGPPGTSDQATIQEVLAEANRQPSFSGKMNDFITSAGDAVNIRTITPEEQMKAETIAETFLTSSFFLGDIQSQPGSPPDLAMLMKQHMLAMKTNTVGTGVLSSTPSGSPTVPFKLDQSAHDSIAKMVRAYYMGTPLESSSSTTPPTKDTSIYKPHKSLTENAEYPDLRGPWNNDRFRSLYEEALTASTISDEGEKVYKAYVRAVMSFYSSPCPSDAEINLGAIASWTRARASADAMKNETRILLYGYIKGIDVPATPASAPVAAASGSPLQSTPQLNASDKRILATETASKDTKKSIRKVVFSTTKAVCQQGYYVVNGRKIPLVKQGDTRPRKTTVVAKPDRIPDSDANKYGSPVLQVKNCDSFDAAAELIRTGHHPIVLNMANKKSPGGGVDGGSMAQEETLCLCSTLADRLRKREVTEGCLTAAQTVGTMAGSYLIPEHGVIVSQGVTVFRHAEEKGLDFRDEPFDVDVVSCAAYARRKGDEFDAPTTTPGGKTIDETAFRTGMEEKVRAVLRAAHANGNDSIVLGAMGCGAFDDEQKNTTKIMLEVFPEILSELEFKGVFKNITFAVLDKDGKMGLIGPFTAMAENIRQKTGSIYAAQEAPAPAPIAQATPSVGPQPMRQPPLPAGQVHGDPTEMLEGVLPQGLQPGPAAETETSRYSTLTQNLISQLSKFAPPLALPFTFNNEEYFALVEAVPGKEGEQQLCVPNKDEGENIYLSTTGQIRKGPGSG